MTVFSRICFAKKNLSFTGALKESRRKNYTISKTSPGVIAPVLIFRSCSIEITSICDSENLATKTPK